MERPDLNKAVSDIANDIKIESVFLIASDGDMISCCVGGTPLDLIGLLAHLFDKNPTMIEIVETALHASEQEKTVKSIFSC